jgi:hypothetical protein
MTVSRPFGARNITARRADDCRTPLRGVRHHDASRRWLSRSDITARSMLRTTLRSNVVRNRRRRAPTADDCWAPWRGAQHHVQETMTVESPSGCTTIKKTKKNFFFLFLFFYSCLIHEPFRVSRTSGGHESLIPRAPSGVMNHKQKQKKKKN